jgi:hypothetical protein
MLGKTLFVMKEKDLFLDVAFQEHRAGTIRINVQGPKTYQLSYSTMHQILAGPVGLGIGGAALLYKLGHEAHWYLTLSQSCYIRKYKELHGKQFDLTNTHGIVLRLEHIDKLRVMGTIHNVHPTYRQDAVEHWVRGFTEDPDAEVSHSSKASDKWVFYFKPAESVEIPHEISVQVDESNKIQHYLVTLPGRKTQCRHCGLDTHWANKCPTRGKPLANVQVPTEGVKSPDTTPSASTGTENPRKKKTTKRPGHPVSPTASPSKIRERKDYIQQENKDNYQIDDTYPDKETTETTEGQKHAQISSPKKLIIDLTPEEIKRTDISQKEQEPPKVNSTR